MILEPGTKVLVSHRRLFEQDHGRFFSGVVEGYERGVARICGHTWVRDGYRGEYSRKSDARTKIISLSSGTVIVYQLPGTVKMDRLRMESENTSLFLRDGSGFEMDLTEGTLRGGEPLPELRRRA